MLSLDNRETFFFKYSYRFETDNRKPIYTDFRPETAHAHLAPRKCVMLTDEREWVRKDCRETSRFVCQKYGKMPAMEPRAGRMKRGYARYYNVAFY